MNRMYSSIQFLNHLVKSRRWDAFHSPYLFRLFTHCCNDTLTFPLVGAIESQRAAWKKSSEVFLRKDLGAGSVFHRKESTVKVSRIAKQALSFPFQCRFMSRLADFQQPSHILEFGTSLGIASAYLSAGAPDAIIHTVEGDPAIAHRAQQLHDQLSLKNITVHASSFNDFTTRFTSGEDEIDLLFLDGDHRLEPTLFSFQSLKSHFNDHTIVVVDDIYWSKDMQLCWQKLLGFPEVTQSVDCFHFGLLFFNPIFKDKEHHLIRLPISMMLR